MLKMELSKEFGVKDLELAKQILGMRITRDRVHDFSKLSQEEYVNKVLSRFNMDGAKLMTTPLTSHFKLFKEQLPLTKQEWAYMTKVPYVFAISSLVYAMMCIRLNIAHVVGVASKDMSNLRKQHWEAVKRILKYLQGIIDPTLYFRKSNFGL